jgi:hypothetical protein
MTSWFLLLLAAGLPAPIPAPSGACPGDARCIAVAAAQTDGAPRAAVLRARALEGAIRETALPSLDACLALARAYQEAHPDAAEDVACRIR